MVARVFAIWVVGVVCAGILSTPLAAQAAAAPCFFADGDHEANQKIFATLRKPLPEAGLDFSEIPLEEIVAVLSDEYDIEIQIDHHALEDLGIDSSQPSTMRINHVSLHSALNLMLKDLDLTHVVADEVLLITTQEEANTRLTICVYPVRDLVDPSYRPTEADKKLRIPAELIPLTNTLITTVASDTWAENGGGESSISGMRPGLLVISQTQAVHEEIRNTLAAIRRGNHFVEENQAAPAMAGEMGMEGGYGGGMRGMGRGGFGGEMGGFGRGGFGEGGFGGGRGFGGEGEPREKAKADDPFSE